MFVLRSGLLLSALCLYAADGAGAGGASAEKPEGSESGEPDTQEKLSFDDLLKDEAYKAEYDKRTEKLIAGERKKWEAAEKTKADEAAKLARMSEEEKARHEREQAEKALADREAAVLKRELTAEAKSQLLSKGLPDSLSDILDYTDAEKCKASIESVAKAFNDAVEKRTNDKLRGTPPKAGQKNTTADPFLAGLGIKV